MNDQFTGFNMDIMAFDLGSTRIKMARLDERGSILDMARAPVPIMREEGMIAEWDGHQAMESLEQLMSGFKVRNPLLGFACQRSSFLIWDTATGQAQTPVISWKDRRATDLCQQLKPREPEVAAITGLPLSPHYAGPKLSVLLARDRLLKRGLSNGSLLFGNLDSFLIWHWSGRTMHITDDSMAARTLMMDVGNGQWSPSMLALFGIPERCLPRIAACDAPLQLDAIGARLGSHLADQAAGALSLLHDPDTVLVVVGTGCFVMSLTSRRVKGLLHAPIRKKGGLYQCSLEGPINCAQPLDDRWQPHAAMEWCLPDTHGLGAPFWQADRWMVTSFAADEVDQGTLASIRFEGFVFRIMQLIELVKGPSCHRLLLAGGGSRHPDLGPALASLFPGTVQLCHQQEATLVGAARLCLGLPLTPPPTGPPLSAFQGNWDGQQRYQNWRQWVASLGLL